MKIKFFFFEIFFLDFQLNSSTQKKFKFKVCSEKIPQMVVKVI